MGKSKESNNNDPSVIKDTVTSHAKRQRLTNIDLSRDPTASFPSENQVSALLEEVRNVSARKNSNKPAARKRLNK